MAVNVLRNKNVAFDITISIIFIHVCSSKQKTLSRQTLRITIWTLDK